MDIEVVDWFKSKGPGYQTRINWILRRVMMEVRRGREKDRESGTPTVGMPTVFSTIAFPRTAENVSCVRQVRISKK